MDTEQTKQPGPPAQDSSPPPLPPVKKPPEHTGLGPKLQTEPGPPAQDSSPPPLPPVKEPPKQNEPGPKFQLGTAVQVREGTDIRAGMIIGIKKVAPGDKVAAKPAAKPAEMGQGDRVFGAGRPPAKEPAEKPPVKEPPKHTADAMIFSYVGGRAPRHVEGLVHDDALSTDHTFRIVSGGATDGASDHFWNGKYVEPKKGQS